MSYNSGDRESAFLLPAALEEIDDDCFFGREEEIRMATALAAKAPNRVPVLVSSSEVGKSSVPMAGVIGALKRQRSASASDP